MKLDFSMLAQPSAKDRGQVGTTGTPTATRACTSPLAKASAGTEGDKPAVVVEPLIAAPEVNLAPLPASALIHQVTSAPQVGPPPSPACPQVRADEKPNAGAMSPVSPLVPAEAAQVAEESSFRREDADGRLTGERDNTCGGCLHLQRHGNCGEPVAAKLLGAEVGFCIVWPPEGPREACPAFIGKVPAADVGRHPTLTNDEVARCHAPGWDDAEIAAFTARTERFELLGRADADQLAERLTLRDRDGDDRRMCLECTWLGNTGRCLAAATGRLPGADWRLEPVQTVLRRCAGFGLRKGLV